MTWCKPFNTLCAWVHVGMCMVLNILRELKCILPTLSHGSLTFYLLISFTEISFQSQLLSLSRYHCSTFMGNWSALCKICKYGFMFFSVLMLYWSSDMCASFCIIQCSSPSKIRKQKKISVYVIPEVGCMLTHTASVCVIFLQTLALSKAKKHCCNLKFINLKVMYFRSFK